MINKLKTAEYAGIVLVIFALFLSSCATEPIALQKSDHLIVSGERVGPIKLGMTEQQVFNLIGSANKSWVFQGHLMYSFRDFTIYVNTDNHKVFSIIVKSQSYHTAEGLGIGAREFDLVHLKGSPLWTERDDRGKPTIVGFDDSTIVFQFLLSGETMADVTPDTVQCIHIQKNWTRGLGAKP